MSVVPTTVRAMRLALLVVAVAAMLIRATAAAADTPVGDGHVTQAGPRAGWAYSCALSPHPAAPPAWIVGGRFVRSRKPAVAGSVRWRQAAFGLLQNADNLFFTESTAFHLGSLWLAPLYRPRLTLQTVQFQGGRSS